MAEFDVAWSSSIVPRALAAVEELGFIVLRGFLTEEHLKPLSTDVERLTGSFYRGLGLEMPTYPVGQIDRPLVKLVQNHPHVRAPLYDRLQQIPTLLSLPAHDQFRWLAETLLGTDHVGVWPRTQVRFDMFEDGVNRIDWHHDYVYNKGTTASYTFWLPLVDIEPAMGPISIAPGSHRTRDIVFTKTGLGNRFDLTLSAETLSRFEIVTPGTYRSGDLVIMHSLLLHAGNMNSLLDRARLTVLFRMQDLNRLEIFAPRSEAA